jgi:hypothetical protein
MFTWGANRLIKIIGGPLGECFLKNILEKNPQKFCKSFYKKICTILLKILLKFCQKYDIFKVFQVHLQVLFLLKNNGQKSFHTTFESPNVNEIISYFGHYK